MINFYALAVTINAVDKTDRILWRSFKVNDELNEQPNVCSFEIKKYGDENYAPTIGDDVVVSFNGTNFFSGKIVSIDNEGDRFSETYKVTCKDNTILLDNILITKRYSNTTIDAIIADIISDARFDAEITDNNVDANITITSIVFNNIPASKCIQKLADQVGYSWYIDENKDIHFFASNTEIAPFNLSATSNNYIENSLSYNLDISQLKNFVKVRGGERVSDTTKTYTTKGNGTTDTFYTIFKYSTVPTVTVGGISKTVGIEYLDAEADYDCFWSFQEMKIRFKVAPADASVIQFTGYPLVPIIVPIEDSASISEYGRVEYQAENKGIKSTEEAQQYGQAMLDAYSQPILELDFKTYEVGLRSGQTISIITRGISDSYIIQSVELEILACSYGSLEELTNINLDNIQTSEAENLIVNAGNSGALVFPVFKVKCSNTKSNNLITFLQNLLLKDSLNSDLDDNVSLEILNLDKQNIKIEEDIDRIYQTIEYVLGDYFPTDPLTDTKRQGRLDISLDLV